MRISAVVDDLAAELVALGSLGDEAMADAAARLARAMPGPLTARVLGLLGDVACELDATLDHGRAEVRLNGGDVHLVVVDEGETTPPATGRDPEPDGDADARITLRLPNRLKAQVEEAASKDGVSVNTWVQRTLQAAARTDRPERTVRIGRRLTGYGQS